MLSCDGAVAGVFVNLPSEVSLSPASDGAIVENRLGCGGTKICSVDIFPCFGRPTGIYVDVEEKEENALPEAKQGQVFFEAEIGLS